MLKRLSELGRLMPLRHLLPLGMALPLGLSLLPIGGCNITTTNGTGGGGGGADLSVPGSSSDLSTGGGSGSDGGTDGGGGGGGGEDSGVPYVPDGGCVGRQCQINYNCPVQKGPTTITGTVTIPAGNLPINNAIVYIPGGAVPSAPPSGASCNRCDSAVPSDAAASTTTDINGKFTLSYAPSGTNVPVVISVGKWRRVVTIPTVSDCTTTTITPDQTRLPRNQTEGNIPKIALTTGRGDAMECLLRSKKLGLDDSEFTNPTGTGRVNLFSGGIYNASPGLNTQGTSSYSPALGGATFPPANGWWDSLGNLSSYDIVMMSCESAQNPSTKSANALNSMQRYINAGGRVFASHYHNYWISAGPAPLNTVASFLSFGGYQNDTSTITATINQGFPKGAALANWLQLPTVGATTNLGQLPITASRVTLTGRNAALTTDWVDFSDPNYMADGVIAPASQYFSFNAPVGATPANQCGQMVFTDMHVSGTISTDQSGPTYPFPSGCTTTGLTPQEKALIFLFFDLSSCLNPT